MEVQTGYLTRLAPPALCRAFIAHASRDIIDRQSLSEYAGKLIDLHHRWVFPDEVETRENTLVAETLRVFDAHGFNARRDYIVTGGDPLITAAVIWSLRRSHLPITLLRYDRQRPGYFPFRLTDPPTQ